MRWIASGSPEVRLVEVPWKRAICWGSLPVRTTYFGPRGAAAAREVVQQVQAIWRFVCPVVTHIGVNSDDIETFC